ncbi:MAG: SDR family NAD(P)-dependent oxidoreductase [Desulfobacterales bacterium]|nr:MAG: SDR family NAD(P)-dependent oxidoreductase [Desulfobacterales bacterium]
MIRARRLRLLPAGLVPFPTQTAYVATQFSVVGFSKSLRLEAADFGVNVSVVCPGFVRTHCPVK